MPRVNTILISSLFIAGASICAMATPQRDLHLGHFEVQIDYTPTPGDADAGWGLSVSYDTSDDFSTAEGIIRLDPADTRMVATPDTEIVRGSAITGFADVGDRIWELPQFNDPGKLFFGWRNVIEPGIFQQSVAGNFRPGPLGSIVLELVSVSGPAVAAGGEFAMWESTSEGTTEVHFNSADGIDASDRIEPFQIGGHTHYAYGLTEPGNYEVTFRASGRLNPGTINGGQDTSQTGTFLFAVPFSSAAIGSAELRLSTHHDPGPAAIHPTGETVEYAPAQVALVTEAMEVSGTPRDYTFLIELVTDQSTAEPHRIGLAGVAPVRFGDGIVPAANPIDVISLSGPGNLDVVDDGSGAWYFVFSESGIYRVTARAVGLDGGSLVYSPRFELIFLAGLDPDYTFAEYADSFERTHGLVPGSLNDDGSDFDGDRIPDIIEYQLFWEGLDPAIADADRLPKPDPGDPEGLIIFYRDTYKDRMNRDSQNIVLEYSDDLSDWRGWSDRDKSFPLEQYETGAEKGNALGRVQRRVLKLPEGEANPARAYFRWRIDP